MLIRPVQYRDLDSVRKLYDETAECLSFVDQGMLQPLRGIHRLYGPVKLLGLFHNPMQHVFCLHVAQLDGQVVGLVQVRPRNAERTAWQVEHIAVVGEMRGQGVGTQLLSHIFEYYRREARNWMVEVNIHNRSALALYRQNGFQSLAQLCYWQLSPAILAELAGCEKPPLNFFKPVSNADAALMCQLESATMPPIVRHLYDRHPSDFHRSLVTRSFEAVVGSFTQTARVAQFVFESQRKAAIGSFELTLSTTGLQPHRANLLVHPAYTWLYPQLAIQIATIAQHYPAQALHVVSTDYQPEREEFLRSIGAEEVERKLLMSRSMWRKQRESRNLLEGLQLSEMLPGFSLGKPMPEPFRRSESNREQEPPANTGWQ
ncbi:GNAT family N-acetyltransferase [Gloeobacter kilaueensis]|uniref:Acetyltransferase n=1 Tax=Gloeobacter kilaueensis (strain ATCC BAA-2537 / CCAP 1431/1 / ULC 316 / JS1) TaxID=1183438 RepID=U5QCL2_GLOK1|nr:GNAT family N-acetyltransferase [Gloeobacter kilaueensis]AGY56616.1 acetyltransferase [Gloeobacter kilaueensis JS1]